MIAIDQLHTLQVASSYQASCKTERQFSCQKASPHCENHELNSMLYLTKIHTYYRQVNDSLYQLSKNHLDGQFSALPSFSI